MHIPFKGGAPATQALLAGDTQFMFDNLANAMAQVKAGKLKALAVTTAERSKLVPELPTMAEAGLPGFDISTWYGFSAPARPPPVIAGQWESAGRQGPNPPRLRAHPPALRLPCRPARPRRRGARPPPDPLAGQGSRGEGLRLMARPPSEFLHVRSVISVGNALCGVPRIAADVLRRSTERHRGRSLQALP